VSSNLKPSPLFPNLKSITYTRCYNTGCDREMGDYKNNLNPVFTKLQKIILYNKAYYFLNISSR
jgi:hypothetical protein